jgi:AcrR family transcriptional regulator
MKYLKPIQKRAESTEKKFLDAMDLCLRNGSYNQTTVEEIAARAGLHRGAFLKRFGSKKNALLALYDRYCDDVMNDLAKAKKWIATSDCLVSLCAHLSSQLEVLQRRHFGSNRAMHEYFLDNLETDAQTQRIFLETVELMRLVQRHWLSDYSYSDVGAFSATQLLVTINYNFVLQAMPALPRDDGNRHQLIAECMACAMKR